MIIKSKSRGTDTQVAHTDHAMHVTTITSPVLNVHPISNSIFFLFW